MKRVFALALTMALLAGCAGRMEEVFGESAVWTSSL